MGVQGGLHGTCRASGVGVVKIWEGLQEWGIYEETDSELIGETSRGERQLWRTGMARCLEVGLIGCAGCKVIN